MSVTMTVTRLNEPEMYLYHKAVSYWMLLLVPLGSTGELCLASQESLLPV